MKEFLVFAGIVLVIAMIVAFWPAIFIIGTIVLIIFIARKLSQKAEEQEAYERRNRIIREAEEREREEERQRTIQQKKEYVINRVDGYFERSVPQLKQAYEYIKSLDDNDGYYFAVAIGELREYKDDIKQFLSEASEKGELETVYYSFELLNLISTNYNNEYESQKENILFLKGPLDNNSCYLYSDSYGNVDYNILKQIDKIDIQECREHITDYDIYLLLWIFAIKEPFDVLSFKTIYHTVKKFKILRGDVPIDSILSAVYVANKHCDELSYNLISRYKKDAEYYLCSVKDSKKIADFSSILCWIGDKDLEYFALKRLYDMNSLPSNLQKRFKTLDDSLTL